MMKQPAILHDLRTRWSDAAMQDIPHNDYPRPQLKRDNWQCLNGLWKYAVCDDDRRPDSFDGEIRVPFSPETLLSGVNRQLMPGQTLWYQRRLDQEKIPSGMRLMLHFGAVDQHCTVWLNDTCLGSHSGGYHPFSFDITDAVGAGRNLLTLCVKDDTDAGPEPFGKQRLRRGGIWYKGQSGIWQTVWTELVPERHIQSLRITPLFDEKQVEVQVNQSVQGVCTVRVKAGESIVCEGETDGTVRLPMGDFRPWSPEDPFLYDLEVTAGEDRVESYFGMRCFGMSRGSHGRKVLTLNGRPIFHHGLLDQGYWSDGMYTPPCDEAMVWEIETLKKMGFNMLRKHIKIEPLRWYYHCDRLGMLVWQDFVSGGGKFNALRDFVLPNINVHLNDHNYRHFERADEAGRRAFCRDAERTVEHLYNAVSLCCWVPFNEGWGQFESAEMEEKVRAMDATRHIDHASGYHDQGAGDFHSRHIYFRAFKPKGDVHDRAMALTEFGGYSLATPEHMTTEKSFGYKGFKSVPELEKAFVSLYEREILPAIEQGLCVDIYTQVSDVEDEINGIFTYDREVRKISEEAGLKVAKMIRDAYAEVTKKA